MTPDTFFLLLTICATPACADQVSTGVLLTEDACTLDANRLKAQLRIAKAKHQTLRAHVDGQMLVVTGATCAPVEVQACFEEPSQ